MNTILPTTLPPGIEWRWAMCNGGPCDGIAKEIPAVLIAGQRVRWYEGVYIIGELLTDTEIRMAYWWDY